MKISSIILVTIAALILLLSVRGLPGNPTKDVLNDSKWIENGPFELSPERGRFALLYSIVEDKKVTFSPDIARFTLPDLGYKNGKYVSLFAPGVSILTIPGYLLGKYLGASQFVTFLTGAIFAIFNIILIKSIAKKLGSNDLTALISGLLFLFATPAFSYAVALYQHHISTFLILASIYTLLITNTFKGHLLIWFLYATAIIVDYPNGFLMLPIILFSLIRIVIKSSDKEKFRAVIGLGKLSAVLAVIPVLVLFFWFNLASYGNLLQLSGTVDNVYEIDYRGVPILTKYIAQPETDKNKIELSSNNFTLGFFKTKNLISGLYVHLLSPDRGVIFYAPIVLFGLTGIKLLNKRNPKYSALLFSVIAINLLLYSMWGDPWGGWAFGSRYLIPSYAILSIYISLILKRISRSRLFLIVFYLVLAYSIGVNTLGAVTSSSNPPKGEAQALSLQYKKDEKYTYERNWEMINKNKSKSFVFLTFANSYLSAWQYFVIISTLVMVNVATPLVLLYMKDDTRSNILAKRNEKNN